MPIQLDDNSLAFWTRLFQTEIATIALILLGAGILVMLYMLRESRRRDQQHGRMLEAYQTAQQQAFNLIKTQGEAYIARLAFDEKQADNMQAMNANVSAMNTNLTRMLDENRADKRETIEVIKASADTLNNAGKERVNTAIEVVKDHVSDVSALLQKDVQDKFDQVLVVLNAVREEVAAGNSAESQAHASIIAKIDSVATDVMQVRLHVLKNALESDSAAQPESA
jgi:hypothetical protein